MAYFTVRITLRGSNGKTVTQSFVTKDFAGATVEEDFTAAVAAGEALADAYADISNATVAKVDVSYSNPPYESGVLPVAADIFEYATIACHLNPPAELEKIQSVRVIAPQLGIFIGSSGVDRDIVDRADTALQAFITEIAEEYTVSDGETINTTSGVGGMKNGRRNARSFKAG